MNRLTFTKAFSVIALALIWGLGLGTHTKAQQDRIYSANGISQQSQAYSTDITDKLKKLLSANPTLKEWLELSLAEAKKLNPDPKTNPAQSIEEYYGYIDEAVKLIPQDILDNPSDLIRDQILQSICYFYFLVDQPIPDMKNSGVFKNALQYHPQFSSWLAEFAIGWGEFLDLPASFSDATYQQFYADPNFRLNIGDYEPRSNWNSFNRFFSRYLASPSKRPISDMQDNSVVVSPADSVPQGVWPIDADSNIQVDNGKGLRIKNVRHFNVNDLLGPDLTEFHNIFANGVLTHTFLNVYDYHRYHFAVGGQILGVAKVQQNVALEVSWDAQNKKYVPIDSTGWQFTQTRGIVIVDTQSYGKVALIPMGMAQVSSVNFESHVVHGNSVRKGDMLGTFLFGGSDFVMLFQKEAGFVIQAPTTGQGRTLDRESQSLARPTYQHMLMGQRYGQMKGGS